MDNIWEYIIRVDSDLSGAIKDLLELEAINARLQNQNLENARKSREEAAARKQLAEDAKQAAQAQIAAELGVSKAMENQKGIIEELRARIKLLKQGREQADDVASINKYNSALQISQKQLNELTGATDKFKGSNGFWRDMQGWVIGALAVDRLTDWGTTLVVNEGRLEAQRTALQNVIKSNSDYQNSIAFLSKLSNDYGQDLLAVTKTYTSFIASSESSNLSLKERNRIYESIIKAGSTLKLSNEEIEGSLRAVSQMFSKGNVQAEELRGQLGERLPGAFGLAAKAMGVSEQKLGDMMKAGQVLAVDLLPKLATELEKTFGKGAASNLETLTGSYNLLKNKVLEYFDGINKTYGITKTISDGTKTLANNLNSVVDVTKTAVVTFFTYQVATRLSAAYTAALNAVQLTGNVIKTQATLRTAQLTGNTIALAAAEAEATAATAAFNAVTGMSPLGALALLLGTAVAAYQLYSNSVEAAQEQQKKLSSGIADALTPLRAEQLEFNKLSKEVLNNKLTIDQRNKALDTLQEKFPLQMKGIGDLKEAELKLGGVIRSTNNDFVNRAKLLENEVKLNYNREKANVWLKEQIELESKLATASSKSTFMVTGTAGNVQQFDSERVAIEKAIASRKRWVENAMKANQELANSSDKVTSKLVFNYEKEEKAAGASAAGTGKANKEKIDSAKTLALIQEKAANDALEKTRRTEQKSLELERDIAIQRINDSKASETKKSAERLKIVEKYFVDSSKLTNKYDDEEAKQQQKTNEKWLKENYEMHKNVTEQAAKRMAEVQKLNEKDYKEKQKLDEKAIKETEKLNQDKYELFDKMRILDRIKQAKNSKEIIEIENEEKEKILIEVKKSSENQLLIANLKLARMKSIYGEDSKQYKEALADMIIAQQNFTQDSIKLTDFLSEKFKEWLKNHEINVEKAFRYSFEVVSGVVDMIDASLNKVIENTSDVILKAQLNNQKQALDIAKQGLSAIASFASGDIVGGVFKTVETLITSFDLMGNASERVAQARMEQAINLLNEYLEVVRKDVDEILSYFDKVNDTYQGLAKNDPLAAFSKASLADIIGMEVKRGELIQSNYEKSINAAEAYRDKQLKDLETVYGKLEDKENDRYSTSVDKINKQYDLEISNINKKFDLEIQKINSKYDLINEKANQAYSAETLSITAAGSKQLEALITNEISLSSVRDEFAKKRLEVEKAFPLASKAITEGMTQTEIDAINASIKARDEQLAKLQVWYNEELVFIATSEGQKRKEYTETEKIQNKIRESLELAAIKFEASEIIRNKEKQDALIKAEKEKQDALIKAENEKNVLLAGAEVAHKLILEQIESAHVSEMERINKAYNDSIVTITKQRDADIAASFANLQSLVSAEIDAITRAMEASAAKGTDAYRAMAAELERLLALQRTINGGSLVPVIPNIPIDIPRGFKDGTERLPNMSGRSGVDTEIIRADVGERIMQTGINNQLKSFFGRDLTNNELAFRAMNSTMPMMNYEMLANLNNNTNFTDKELLSEMKSINKGLKNLKQVNVDVKNGHPTVTERSSNRMIIYS